MNDKHRPDREGELLPPRKFDFAPSAKTRRLAICIALSLLLHIAVLWGMRTPTTTSLPVAQRPPLTVYFIVPPIPESSRLAVKAPAMQQNNSARLLTAPAPRADLPDTRVAPAEFSNPQQLLESARDIARDEGVKAAQHDAAQEQRSTPLVALEQYLRQPHKEIHLANGIVKIVTEFGEICFRPAPSFARDDLGKGAFGMPTTCP